MDLGGYPERVQTLIPLARKLMREWLSGAQETEGSSPAMFAYADGPGYRGMICTLILSKTGVKLGIVEGASFPDPHKLLRGSGKVHRHVPLKSPEDLRQPGLKDLVIAARAACTQRMNRM